MKPKHSRTYKGKGNRHNRFKRDTKTLSRNEKGAPAGFIKLRWQ